MRLPGAAVSLSQRWSVVVGQQFDIGDGTATVSAPLVSCEVHECTDSVERFSLVFRMPLPRPPAQGIYHVHHPEIGPMEIFLVPVAADGQHVDLEAVFNLTLVAPEA